MKKIDTLELQSVELIDDKRVLYYDKGITLFEKENHEYEVKIDTTDTISEYMLLYIKDLLDDGYENYNKHSPERIKERISELESDITYYTEELISLNKDLKVVKTETVIEDIKHGIHSCRYCLENAKEHLERYKGMLIDKKIN